MFQIEVNPSAATVRVRSAIDFSTQVEFEAMLRLAIEGDSARLIVSLEDCTFLDCAGIAILVKIRNDAKMPMSIVLAEDSYFRKLFAILELEEHLNVAGERYTRRRNAGPRPSAPVHRAADFKMKCRIFDLAASRFQPRLRGNDTLG